MAKHRFTHTTPHDRPGSIFSHAKDLSEILPGSTPTEATNAGAVGQNRQLSTNSWLYIENGPRQTYSFY